MQQNQHYNVFQLTNKRNENKHEKIKNKTLHYKFLIIVPFIHGSGFFSRISCYLELVDAVLTDVVEDRKKILESKRKSE